MGSAVEAECQLYAMVGNMWLCKAKLQIRIQSKVDVTYMQVEAGRQSQELEIKSGFTGPPKLHPGT